MGLCGVAGSLSSFSSIPLIRLVTCVLFDGSCFSSDQEVIFFSLSYTWSMTILLRIFNIINLSVIFSTLLYLGVQILECSLRNIGQLKQLVRVLNIGQVWY